MKTSSPAAAEIPLYADSWLCAEVDAAGEVANPQEWHLEAIHASDAWESSQGEGVLIAVIDTGISLSHPEFSECLIGADTIIPESAYLESGYFNPAYQGPEDYLGHGTHVAGLIAARADGTGSTGAAPRAKLLSIKALESDGVRGNGKTSWVAAAIGKAVDAGAKIINLSIGGAMQDNALLWEAIRRANESGVLVVCAAGNSGTSSKCYPAAYPETVAVSAVRRQGDSYVFASYSNYGDWIDICAPGSNLYGPSLNGSYTTLTGTSMACPLVSAGAALLLGQDPSLTPDQLQYLLLASSEDLGAAGKDERYGTGLLNLYEALQLLQEKNELIPPVSDCPDGSVLTDETVVRWKSDSLHGEIYYTLDGTEPDANGLLWPAEGRTFPVGNTVLKLAVCCNDQVGEVQTVHYTVIAAQEILPEDVGEESYRMPTYGIPEKRLQIVIPAGDRLNCTLTAAGGTAQVALYDQNGTLLSTEENGKLMWKNSLNQSVTGLLKITAEGAEEFTLKWECAAPAAEETEPTQPPTSPATEATVPPETTAETEAFPEETEPQSTTEEPLFQVELVTNEGTQPEQEEPPEEEEYTEYEPEHSFWIPLLLVIGAGALIIGYCVLRKRSLRKRRKYE